ncbi:MAG: hypothetical protein MUO26_15490 [Methanotrichaceae archaeon]|nr:hypothetical protein [Methanotrichaceae archaeon]
MPELDCSWNGKSFVLIYDSDFGQEHPGYSSFLRFGAQLLERGATSVKLLTPPDIRDFEKVGLDDFLNYYGNSGVEKLNKLIARAKSSKELFKALAKNKDKKNKSSAATGAVESKPAFLDSGFALGEPRGLSAAQKVAELVGVYGEGVRDLISYEPTIEAPELLMDVVQASTAASEFEFVGIHAGSIKRAYWLLLNGRLILPPPRTDLVGLAVILPEHPESYGTLSSLAKEIELHLHKWLDVSPLYEKIASYYVVFTWVFDRVNSLPYLRALGDTGTGKSRFLDVIGGTSTFIVIPSIL